MSIETKLQYLEETKTQIKQAIVDKGIEVTDSDTFRSYANKINDITTNGVLPKNIAGLDYLLDGEYNLVTGSDHSTMNAYNLVKPSYTTTVAGTCDFSNGVVSFTDKSFVPAGTFFTPKYNSEYFTWDFVIKFSEAPLTFTKYCSLVHANGGASACGYSIHIDAEDSYRALIFMASTETATNSIFVASPQFWEPDEICYYTVTSNALTGETRLYKNGEETQNYSTDTHAPYKFSKSAINTGLFGCQGLGTTSGPIATNESEMWNNGAFLFPNINVYTIRHWNRILTPYEIKQNYLQDKKRFGEA